jgi:acyl carrier protein
MQLRKDYKLMKEQLMEILDELRPDVDFEMETALIDDGILGSFDIVSLVGELNDNFDIEINVDDLLPENFNSVEAMLELIEKLQEEG